ncbi:MAG TPA: LON peptidase substrate-binding domain-containing protein [Thermoanaerobaculia bacterium]|nr:LON peptidase substrate-binding domain-containing protein [Thermoanaerobaculia bacterium]
MAADDDLPAPLPLFPLTGVLLLPGNLLPLHVFEPRYRNLVEDALAGSRHLGMIQPRTPLRGDDRGEAPPQPPELHAVGCAGRLVSHTALPGDRYLVVLQGVCRFRIRRELPLLRGYRRAMPDYAPFLGDRTEGERDLDTSALLEVLEGFRQAHALELVGEQLASATGAQLLNLLAAHLPFPPAEKQALLEATCAEERQEILLALLRMSLARPAAELYRTQTLH